MSENTDRKFESALPQQEEPATYGGIMAEWSAYKKEVHSRGIGGKDLDCWLTEKLVESSNSLTQALSSLAAAQKELQSLREQNAALAEICNLNLKGVNAISHQIGKYNELKAELQSLRDKESASWIDIKQKLPPEGVPLIIVWSGVVQHLTYARYEGRWYPYHEDPDEFLDDVDSLVTHWMPLPSAPAKLEQETK
jgi:hypothetical protein